MDIPSDSVASTTGSAIASTCRPPNSLADPTRRDTRPIASAAMTRRATIRAGVMAPVVGAPMGPPFQAVDDDIDTVSGQVTRSRVSER
jgi:hypothetical protein